jgi:hypothetical protein
MAGSVAVSSIGTWTVPIRADQVPGEIGRFDEPYRGVRPGGVEPPNLQIKSPLLYR